MPVLSVLFFSVLFFTLMNPEQPTLANLEAQQRELARQFWQGRFLLILAKEVGNLVKILSLETKQAGLMTEIKELENLIREN